VASPERSNPRLCDSRGSQFDFRAGLRRRRDKIGTEEVYRVVAFLSCIAILQNRQCSHNGNDARTVGLNGRRMDNHSCHYLGPIVAVLTPAWFQAA